MSIILYTVITIYDESGICYSIITVYYIICGLLFGNVLSLIGRAQLKSASCGVFPHNSSQFLATFRPTPVCVIGALDFQKSDDEL